MARTKSGDSREPLLVPRGAGTPPKRQNERSLGRPINSDGEETRRLILTAARECFATYGYAATTNRLIAERTGYTAAAVYHHFGRKNDLMLAVYEATQQENYVRMRIAIEGKQTLIAKVDALLDVTHRILAEDRAQATFMFVAREEAKRHVELSEISHDRVFAKLFAEIVGAAVEDGEVDEADAKYVRAALMVITGGLANLGTDVTPAAHKIATESCKRLLSGTLMKQAD
ncbi:TetR/AcrR family transcriptional regulator [Mycolicibacterium fortuitum]|nr:TetR/AcrR family transcriptional regulator [Mycolicibacterium fortuitum]